MSHFVKWKPRVSALFRSRRKLVYLCLVIVAVFVDNFEGDIRRGLGLGECDKITHPVKMFYQRFLTVGHSLRADRVVLISYSAHEIPALGEPCNKRALVAAIINRLEEPDIDPAVIAVDHWYDPAFCTNPEDQERSKELGDALAKVSTHIPIVLGEDSDTWDDLRDDPDLPKLKENGFSRNDQILRPSAFSGPNWPNLSFGLARINCDNRRIPLGWWVFPSALELKKSDRRWEPSLAYATARLANQNVTRTLQPLIDQEGLSGIIDPDKHPFTAFIPEQAFSPLKGGTLKATAILCRSDVPGTVRAMIDCSTVKTPSPDELRSMRGTVVLLGEDSSQDRHPSVLGAKVPGYVLQANYINSLLSGYYFRPLNFWVELVLALGGTLLLVTVFELAPSMGKGLIASTVVYVGIVIFCNLVSLYFRWFFGFWLTLFLVLITEIISCLRVGTKPSEHSRNTRSRSASAD